MRLTRMPLIEIIERAREIVDPIVAACHHTLVVKLPSKPLIIDCDATWLSQALQNLISNAAKYTEPGGKITVSVQHEGTDAVIAVSDTGIGIPTKELDTIFGLYTQLEQRSTVQLSGGLGIGLHLVRLLVEAHGGTIQSRSAGPSCGSEFIVRLPCVEPSDCGSTS